MYKILALLCLISILRNTSYSQIIPFQNFTVKNGLPSNYVQDIAQDKKGYMWFATQVGAVKYDGYKFENYNIQNGLSNNDINVIEVDLAGNIYLGTYSGGLNILSGKEVQIIDVSKGLASNYISDIFFDNDKNIWCITDFGFSIVYPDTVVSFTQENSIIKYDILCHGVDSKNRIWLGTADGLFLFNGNLQRHQDSLFRNFIIRDILEDKKGRIWQATQEHGVICIDDNNITRYNTLTGFGTDTILSLYQTKDERIFVGTYDEGILIINPDGSVDNQFQDDSKDVVVLQFLEDHYGKVWAQTVVNGVIQIDRNEIRFFTEENNLCNNGVSKIFEDLNYNIWITTESGVSMYGKSVFEIFNQNLLNDDKYTTSVYVDEENQIYIASYSGLTILRSNKEPRLYTSENGLPVADGRIFDIIKGNDDEIWLATFGGLSKLHRNRIVTYPSKMWWQNAYPIAAQNLLYDSGKIYAATPLGFIEFKDGKYTLFDENKELKYNDLLCVEKDVKGNIWFGANQGLVIYDSQEFHHYNENDGLSSNICNDICFDPTGKAWIATEQGISIVELSDEYKINCINIDISNGLGSNIVGLIHVNDKGYIWAGHNKGIDRINPEDYSIKNYNDDDGFLPIETNLGAVFEDRNNNIWFGTVEGVVKYVARNDIENKQEPLIYITGISFYDDTSSLTPYYFETDTTTGLPVDLELPYNKNNLVFEYIGLHYTIVSKNRYQYMLEGYEDWQTPIADIKTPPYRKLPPGKYTFKVKAANCDGVWTKEPATFSFIIKPPFWKTWWFYTIEIVGGIGLIILIIILRERKLQHDKKVLTQKVKERTLEIEQQKDKISAQKQEITDSILYAQRIQAAVLPKSETIRTILPDSFILYKPRDIVSGDFYWINGNLEKVILVAADCTGHGVPGGFMSMLGVSILNEIAHLNSNKSSGRILNELRDHIKTTLSQTGEEDEAKDGMDLALCILDFKKRQIQFSGAYNPLVLIRDSEIIDYKADKMPIGIHAGLEKEFTTQIIDYKKGDCIYMFSDGYADQFGGPEGKKFKSLPLKRLMAEIHKKSMDEQKQILDKTFEDWKGDEVQIDDILVVGVRLN